MAGDFPVVLYGRVSHLKDDERSRSVDDQLAELRRWATREQWPIIAEHRDDGISASRFATTKTRPGWQQVRDLINSGQVRGLLVWEFSRASRDDKASATLKQACITAGVKIGYSGQLHDPSTAQGGFNIGLHALLAAYQSDESSERILRARRSAAERGDPYSTMPYGYRRVVNADGRPVWVLHPDEAPIVQEMVTRLLAGDSANSIAADLNRRGVRPRRSDRWHAASISSLARKPSLAAIRIHQGEVTETRGTWPPILSEEQHHEVTTLLDDPTRARHPKNVALLGVGLYRCGADGCQGRMAGWARAGRKPAYRCRVCYGCFIARDPTDVMVRAATLNRLSNPDTLAALNDDSESVAAARAELTRLRRKVADLEQALADDHMTVAQFTRLNVKLASQVAEVELQARPSYLPRSVFDLAGDDAHRRWEPAPLSQRREAVAALLDVVIMPGRRGTKGFDGSRVRITAT